MRIDAAAHPDKDAVVEYGDLGVSWGDLYARNPSLISGYHDNEDATRPSQRDGFCSVGDCDRVDAEATAISSRASRTW